MSVRKLVIASKMNGVGEIIKHGKTGLLHKPKDFIALAEILEKIFTTPAKKWEQMRNQALQIWQEKFTLDKMTDKLVNIYRELGLINHD
jgi:glycosyltransferase involved in cell wall biosynthesis